MTGVPGDSRRIASSSPARGPVTEPRSGPAEFERKREQGVVRGEPGDAADAPYRREHFFATSVERLLAAEVGVDWEIYETYVDSLGIRA